MAEIQDLRLIRKERPYVAKYLKALWLNNTDVVTEYESFGNSARQLLMNRREYDQHPLFGFMDIAFNQYGWLERPKFLDVEHFEFPHRDGWAVMNHITIGRGINGKWSYYQSECNQFYSIYKSRDSDQKMFLYDLILSLDNSFENQDFH